MPTAAPRPQRSAGRSAVVDLAQARDARRLRDLGERCRSVDEGARRTLTKLFGCGTIFTRHGSRIGRDLLLCHQHLLRAAGLLGKATECDATDPEEADALYQEAAGIVERAHRIVARCEAACSRGT